MFGENLLVTRIEIDNLYMSIPIVLKIEFHSCTMFTWQGEAWRILLVNYPAIHR